MLAGAVNETVARPFSTVATGDVGALGTVAGVTGPVRVAVDVPEELVATVENLYDVPFVSPAIVHVVAGVITVQLPAVRPVTESIAVTT